LYTASCAGHTLQVTWP